ncbi:hemolysin family protein [Wenyingzhuangia sp. 2_MG-2023]|uniref:hemolysin family protein n=1 Tax=Wenyingzhuangia sp. 2_MG-2023 TaxID=3062639 RepID=UPI0026E402E7|nr:hemolysin family protein [Wenyingzhuangia sp. 2_MG-2023]MDO6737216.1 hemolysin family protein [Wenyingzhuangia sp. 2_MG-2023]MDO6801706.1 hemolysin family protein [Wenyingzhuangia sp. 1_MG-2023]
MDSEILIIIVSIILSAFFSGLEIAFVSSNKLQVALEKRKDGFRSQLLTKLTERSSKFITTMLVGNNIALVVYSYYMGEKLLAFFPSGLNEATVLILSTLISTLLILVLAEFLPKAIFRVYANETLRFFAVPAYFFYLLFHFISIAIDSISSMLLKFFFGAHSEEGETVFSKEELGHYIDKQIEIGRKDDEQEIDSEIQIFQNALSFNSVKAREIMVPRTDLVAVELHERVSKLKQLFVDTGFSKILVYKTSMDDIVGYVHAYEMFKNPKTIKTVILPVEYIPESMMINDVLNVMTKKRKSIAVVIDEYGGTSGVITVEDIIEELFGEIEDEHDKIALVEEKINENEFQLSARLEVDYLNEAYELNIPKSESYETLGGFIIQNVENIPEVDEEFVMNNLHIKITKVSNTRIEEVYLKSDYKLE